MTGKRAFLFYVNHVCDISSRSTVPSLKVRCLICLRFYLYLKFSHLKTAYQYGVPQHLSSLGLTEFLKICGLVGFTNLWILSFHILPLYLTKYSGNSHVNFFTMFPVPLRWSVQPFTMHINRLHPLAMHTSTPVTTHSPNTCRSGSQSPESQVQATMTPC